MINKSGSNGQRPTYMKTQRILGLDLASFLKKPNGIHTIKLIWEMVTQQCEESFLGEAIVKRNFLACSLLVRSMVKSESGAWASESSSESQHITANRAICIGKVQSRLMLRNWACSLLYSEKSIERVKVSCDASVYNSISCTITQINWDIHQNN